MSDELLCNPCQRFLSGESPLLDQDDGYLNFIHHTTAESFQQALALPCGICRHLRGEFRRQIRTANPISLKMCESLTYYRPSIIEYVRGGTDYLPFECIRCRGRC